MKKIIVVLISLLMSSTAFARCFPYDGTGFWKSYSINSSGQVGTCSFRVKGNGALFSDGSCDFIDHLGNRVRILLEAEV